LPNSALGLVLALPFLSGSRLRSVDGVLEICSPGIAWCLRHLPSGSGASAITFGHVVLGRDPLCLALTRAHERVHVRQYELWGPLFLPAYLVSSTFAAIRGGDPYEDNYFERQAFAVADPRPVGRRRHLRRL
jgi:hypothetical protein